MRCDAIGGDNASDQPIVESSNIKLHWGQLCIVFVFAVVVVVSNSTYCCQMRLLLLLQIFCGYACGLYFMFVFMGFQLFCLFFSCCCGLSTFQVTAGQIVVIVTSCKVHKSLQCRQRTAPRPICRCVNLLNGFFSLFSQLHQRIPTRLAPNEPASCSDNTFVFVHHDPSRPMHLNFNACNTVFGGFVVSKSVKLVYVFFRVAKCNSGHTYNNKVENFHSHKLQCGLVCVQLCTHTQVFYIFTSRSGFNYSCL